MRGMMLGKKKHRQNNQIKKKIMVWAKTFTGSGSWGYGPAIYNLYIVIGIWGNVSSQILDVVKCYQRCLLLVVRAHYSKLMSFPELTTLFY